MVSKHAIIHPGVNLGKNCVIEEFAIIGVPPKGYASGVLETVIGDNATVRSHTVIYAGNKIGNNFQTGNKANIRELNEIGDDVSIGTLTVIEHHIKIASRVRIHTQVFIPEYSILEEGCWVGPNVVFTNAKYPVSPEVKNNLQGPRICRFAILGANSTLLPGITIGEYALIGAGSVVTRDIARKAVVVGNPARVINALDNLPYGLVP
jgi:acetyltransferase-like isoleucine patch superfamily enzyme